MCRPETVLETGLQSASMLALLAARRISRVDMKVAMPARTTLFLSNRSQAVRLPRAVAFGDGVREVVVTQDGPRRIIAPADAAWDDFFAAPGIDLGSREQLTAEERDEF